MSVLTGMPAQEDPRFRGLREAMLNSTPDCVKLLSPELDIMMMNRAGCRALGVPEGSAHTFAWLPLLCEDVRQAAQDAVLEARSGKTARFAGRSPSATGTLHWDNLLVPIMDSAGAIDAILCVSRDVTDKIVAEQKLAEALEREKLLAREMHHRVKNAFSVVSGLITIAEKEARTDPDHRAAPAILRDKIQVLSRAADALFAPLDGDHDQADLRTLTQSIMVPYGDQYTVSGPDILIDHRATTPLVLFMHELATNAVKYGALSTVDGSVALSWAEAKGTITLIWTEAGGPAIAAAPARAGFGSQMIDRLITSIGGTVERQWHAGGLSVELALPRAPQQEAG